ncbi:MAG: cytochrome c3 family protein [Candidatus Rokubacteria bacterium]|nr:cytochrome c3 family protein [Candidatus Rokubacteria bacterium]
MAAALAIVLACALAASAAPPAPAAKAATAPASPRPDSCVTCHLETGDDRLAGPAKAYTDDIHRAKGFGCTACHGGDPNAEGMEAMDPAKGYIGKPAGARIVQVCGRCHADARFMKQYNPSLRVDQVAEYESSVHGRRLRELKDPKVATCASCHAPHGIRPPSDALSTVHPLRVADTCGRCHADAKYMASYKIPTDQRDKYKKSVHWNAMSAKGDLSAPTCNDCHGNHGAAPPGVNWVGNVCGQCHTVMAELFGKSVHAKAFTQMGVPGCAACHDNHDIRPTGDHMVGATGDAVCASCHNPDDAGGKTATTMRGLLDALAGEWDKARGLLEKAEHAGMEVSQPQFELSSAKDALVKARAAIHAFTIEPVKAEVDGGLAIARKAHARGVRALEELRFRRTGLVVSVVIIVALIGGLLLKIRYLERPRAAGTKSS